MFKSAMVLSQVAAAAAKAPHLVFILVDDMGFNDFHSSSDIAGAWPNVQSLASERCVSMDRVYSQPICTPTRGALMSGRYPTRLGLQHGVITGQQDYGLPLDEATLAEKLHAAGYNTLGVGKWHLGMFNNASLPTRRGFNHFFGYYNGAEDYYTHEVGGYLDLHDDETVASTFNGTYALKSFQHQAVLRIQEHASQSASSPLFLYFAMQNVHSPLQAQDEDVAAEPCASIADADRKTFCGMARAADRTVGKLLSELDEAFPEDDVVVVVSGDNGGNPQDAGNNCPRYGNGTLCLRGSKGSLYEGGVRNNALLCSKTLVPESMRGQSYSGLVHITDWHATLLELAGASDGLSKPIDGLNVFEAITKNESSPRKEFLVNIDPCSGHGSCEGTESAFVLDGCVGKACGLWKYHQVVTPKGWYPPVEDFSCKGMRGCEAPSAAQDSPSAYSAPTADAGDQLHELHSDPNEEHNLAALYPDVLVELKARIEAMQVDDYLAPCNVPSGSCYENDAAAAAVFAEHGGAWVPWVADAAVADAAEAAIALV